MVSLKILLNRKKKIKFYLTRHGFATNNQGIISENSHLTELGIQQAKNNFSFFKNIKFKRIYCSPLNRCLETSKYCLNNRNIYLDDTIMEKAGNICEKRDTLSDIHTYINNEFNNNKYIFYNVNENYIFKIETRNEMIRRIKLYLNIIKKQFKDNDKILIVGHGTWLFEFTKLITGKGISFKNCDIKIVDFRF
jgi:broad specificity phosphatase PhoE